MKEQQQVQVRPGNLWQPLCVLFWILQPLEIFKYGSTLMFSELVIKWRIGHLTSQQGLGHFTAMENFSNVTFPKVVLRKLNLVSKLRLFCHMLFCFAFNSEVFILASQNSTLPVVWSSLWPPCRRPQQELVKFNFSQCLEFDFQGIVEITLIGESTELRRPWFIYSSGNGGIFFLNFTLYHAGHFRTFVSSFFKNHDNLFFRSDSSDHSLKQPFPTLWQKSVLDVSLLYSVHQIYQAISVLTVLCKQYSTSNDFQILIPSAYFLRKMDANFLQLTIHTWVRIYILPFYQSMIDVKCSFSWDVSERECISISNLQLAEDKLSLQNILFNSTLNQFMKLKLKK